MTVAIASGASVQSNCDDMLAIARPFAQKPDFTYDWIRQMVTMLKIAVDYSEESHHDSLVRNHNLQLCLSILNHLGFRGEFQPRSFGGKFAMLTLNVRNIVILITIANNMPLKVKEKLSPLDEPEVVEALGGCAKWAIDLLAWLSDCLFQLADDQAFMAILADPRRFHELAGYLQSHNDVSLHLLLCSSTRGFLSAACRRLSHLEVLSNRAAQFNQTLKDSQQAQQQHKEGEPARPASGPPPALLVAYQKIQRFIGSSPVKVGHFEALVNQLSNDIRTAYQSSLPEVKSETGHPAYTEEQRVRRRQMFELDMLLASTPPPSFQEVIFNFFRTNLAAFKAQTDPAKLYFGNFDLLEVEDDPKSLMTKKELGRHIDVFKRVEVYSGGGSSSKTDGTVAVSRGIVGGNTNGTSGHGVAGQARNTNAGPPTTMNLAFRGGAGGAGGSNDTGNTSPAATVLQWRRCVRCASVMEDIWGHRPGFTFVLAQQRKCACGGNWGLVPRSS